ncbi:Phospholipase D zeta 1-like protein [Drosera capensis]
MMASERLIGVGDGGPRYFQVESEPSTSATSETAANHTVSSFFSFNGVESARIFEELPVATIVHVSRPDAGDISPMLLSYVIELQYKEFKWQLHKKAAQVLYLHFALKKRAFIEEINEKQEQVKEWLQNLGIGDHVHVLPEDDDDEDESVPFQPDESAKSRDIPSSAALPVIRPALGRQHSISDRAKVAMQGYLNHFLGNLDIVNSKEVCRFLEVSKLSFSPEYGPKLKEDYVMVKHLPKIPRDDDHGKCCSCHLFSWCNDNWQKVWTVLKPGFLALLADPFDSKLLDIIVFDVLPGADGNGEGRVLLAEEVKERNPLRHAFKVTCGNRSIRLRTRSNSKSKDWVVAINDAGLRPPEGWCHPHRFGSFAPPRGLTDDGSQAQWFVDGQAAFEAIALAIENSKSEIFICGWWICPELYLRRPFQEHASARLDALLEAKAREGVQIYILLYKEVALALKINSVYSKRRLLSIHENVRVLRFPDHFSTGVYLWESEPNSWEETMKDELDRTKYPRMPWHDVHCALWGPPCWDVARHFVQRWNHAKVDFVFEYIVHFLRLQVDDSDNMMHSFQRNKAPNEQGIPLLMPQQHMVIPHYMGRSNGEVEDNNHSENHMKRQDSFSSRMSSQDLLLLLPQEADGGELDATLDHSDQRMKIMRGVSFSFHKSKVVPLISDTPMKGFVDDFDMLDGSLYPATISSDKKFGDTREHGTLNVTSDETAQVGPCVSCRCQNQFFISGLSGDEIIRNRVLEALYRRILRAYNDKKCFRVIIVLPLLPGFQGGVDDSGAASVRTIMHWQYRTICRGQNSILHNLYDVIGPKADDYISFYGLRAHGQLVEGGPAVSSQVYVHSKIMIIDDCIVLVGSANINDRSLLGSRDSEIGVLIEDKEIVASRMGGKPWKAGKFALGLRLSLWSEHLGLRGGEVSQIYDPVADATYKDIWMATAKTNTMIYQDVFACIPNDFIHSRASLRQNVAKWKEKLGHTTIDLGVAPPKLEGYQNCDVTNTDPMERLQSMNGHLVSFPLDFMSQEDLRPVFNESEYYAAQVFH